MKSLSRQSFLKKIKDTVDHYGMIRKGERVLAAVSGGADSVCLLNALSVLRRKLDIELIAATVDHCLRGEQSENDADFVVRLCGEKGIRCLRGKVKVLSSGKDPLSIEERAREKRYAFLLESAARESCGVLATGHTLDDQVETVLMRIVYGSSLKGISGIAPVRYENEVRIVRPLLRVPKENILHYLEEEGESFVEDTTNDDRRYRRNKIRLELIPLLVKEYNPGFKRNLVNLSDTVREDMEYIIRGREKALSSTVCGEANSVKLKDLLLQPVSLRKELFRELFARAGGNLKKLTYRHWMDFSSLVASSEKGKALDLPGSVKVERKASEVVFSKKR
ncbi:MAG: tRNA lysidine(34) synthetase TilS [Candidatus Omnitrophica bacterium]|nr:tRNA lysidine(34) synthetase TilS [Candidatus Omnitrophota bacterium]